MSREVDQDGKEPNPPCADLESREAKALGNLCGAPHQAAVNSPTETYQPPFPISQRWFQEIVLNI